MKSSSWEWAKMRGRGLFRAALTLSLAIAALAAGCGQSPKVDVITVVSSSMASFPKGTTRQYSALAHYTDNSMSDVSSLVVWAASSDIVKVSNSTGSRGLVTALGVGDTTLSATLNDVVGTTSISVSGATLTTILVAPQNAVIANGTTVQLSATGVYSDLSNLDITSMVAWRSNRAVVATVTASGQSAGLVAGVAPGAAEITASFQGIDGKGTVIITSATLTQLALNPPSAVLAKGTTLQLVATGTFSDNTTQDVTSLVTWTAGASVATVSNLSGSKGLVLGVSKGAAAIQASLSGQTATAALSITDATLTSITVTPANPAIANGSTVKLIATGNFSDGSSQNLSTSVTWASTVPAVAAVSNTPGTQGIASGVGKGQTVLLATLTGTTGSTTLTVTDAVLTSIAVSPASPSVAAGTNLQFIASGTYSDNTTQDLTSLVTWLSSDVTVATVSSGAGSRGLARGITPGIVTISATLGPIAGTAMMTVNNATLSSIAVTPATAVIASGTSQQFIATGTYSNGTTANLTAQVTWSSSLSAVATISNTPGTVGLATALAKGTATITAILGAVSGSTTLGVSNATLNSIEMQPAASSIANGINQQFTAIGHYSDNTTQNITSLVSWTSSDPTVATISSAAGSNGLAKGLRAGSVTITATLGGVSGPASLTVTTATLSSIAVTPATQVIAKGTNLPFTATGTYSDGTTTDLSTQVTWASSNNGVATVSNVNGSNGLASGVAQGTVTVTATLGAKSGTTTLGISNATLKTISVTPTNPSIAHGAAQQFVATGLYSDASNQNITSLVTWTSSDTTVATISNTAGTTGLASTSMAGTTTISAALGAVSGSTTLTVTPANLVSISVTPVLTIIAKGTTQPFTATGVYSDGTNADLTTAATWTSSDTSLATISNAANTNGVASGVAKGTVTITATLGAVSGTTTLGITNATLTSIQVMADDTTIALGTTEQFTAIGIYSDATNQDITSLVTWTSSMVGFATISNSSGTRGLATAVAAGPTSISASLGGVTGSRNLTVTAATLSSIVVTPGGAFLAKGTQQFYTATGIYSDHTTQDLTTTVSWSSDTPAVATVDNSTGFEGLVTAVAAGSANLTATDAMSGKLGATKVTVTNATLVSIAITPATPSIAKGTQVQFTATGTYSDMRKQDLTTLVTWSSSTANVSIDNTAGFEGLASGLGVSTATITAQLGGKSGTTTLTVTAATLVSIAVTPMNASLPIGFSLQYTALGKFSDGSTQDLTLDASLTWGSSSANATIANGAGAGIAQGGMTAGGTTITATVGTIIGSTGLMVTNETLTGITVTPKSAAAGPQQFTATGTFSVSSMLDITPLVTWESSDAAVVDIDPMTGLAMVFGAAGTSATITATFGAVTGTVTLTF